MSDKVYGAELDLNISKFKSKMNEASKEAEMFGKKVKSSVGQVVNGIDTYYTGPSKLIAKTKEELQQTSAEMNRVSKNSSNIGGTIDKSFTKGLKSVKRLTLGFLGARSAFMLFRKYLGEYQSQNEDFANKMQLTTNVLVNSLAPAFEFFANVVQYAVIGLARIIELLTGVNILSKTIDNGFKGASKSAKEFNDNLTGLDEISNIDTSASGLSSGIASQLNALNEFQKKIAEVDKWLEDTGIKKFFEDLRPIVKDVFDWIVGHPLETLGILGGIGLLKTAIPAIIGSSGSLFATGGAIGGTAGTGLLGLAGVLALVGSLAIITISVKTVVDEFNKAKEEIEGTTDAWDGYYNQLDELEEKQTETISEVKDGSNMFKLLSSNLKVSTKDLKEYSDEIENQNKNMSAGEFTIKSWLGEFKGQQSQMDGATKTVQTYIKGLSELRKQNKLDADEKKEYIKLLMSTKKELEETGVKGKDYQQVLGLISSELRAINGKTFTAKLGIDTSSANNSISNFFQKWFGNNPLLKKALNITGIPSYDVGTNYVPRDQIAMVHEGEAIIPKKYNNSEYLGQIGNSETNALLMELNRSILEFANRPQTLNVNGKELAKATYSDYQEEGSRRGANTSIRRV